MALALVSALAVAAPHRTTVSAPDAPSPSAPVQVHLALGYTPDTMAVAWATYDAAPPQPGSVAWSLDSGLAGAQTANGDVRPFTADPNRTWYTHTANMTGLKPSTRYYYRIKSASGEKSKIFSYRTMPDATTIGTDLPEVHLAFGDMGAADAFTLCSKCNGNTTVCDATTCATANQSAGLISEIHKSSHIIHTGDFAYDFESRGGTVGDQFMVNIEQVAANVPYMTSIGNHENGEISLAHYTERFRHMPTNSGTVETINKPSVGPNNWYFSWDAGLVHYIAMSTELYFGVKGGVDGNLKSMYEWMEADLKKANANRANVPWIIVHGHRSIYCSCDGDCDAAALIVRDGILGAFGMEELFFKYGVDLFLNGHEHDYERSWPVYRNGSDQSNVNPKATIYVVTGAAGSHELHEPFTRVQPEWSSFRSNTFGYSKMTIYNHSHMHWQQIQTDPTLFGPELYGRVIDDTWIVQPNHGPFDVNDPPSGRCPESGCKPGVSYDHWLPLLNLDQTGADHDAADGVFSGRKEYELIKRFREHNGEGQWKRTELNLLARAQAALGGESFWEDVHEDGNSDSKYAGPAWADQAS